MQSKFVKQNSSFTISRKFVQEI